MAWRRRLRRLGLVLAILVAVVALGLGGIVLALATDPGRRLAAEWAGLLLSDAWQTVQIAGIGAGLPDELLLEGVSVSDEKGPWLAIEAIRLSWHPTSLLRRRIAVARLQVGELTLSRLPEARATTAQPVTLPRFGLPLDVEIGKFRFDDVRLGAAVAGTEARLGIEGTLRAQAQGQVTGQVRLRRLDQTPAEARFDLAYDPLAATLAVAAQAEEAAGGMLPTLLGAPDVPFRLELKGSGGFDAWRGRVDAGLGERPLLGLDIATTGYRITTEGQVDLARYLPELGAVPLAVALTLAHAGGRHWRLEEGRLALPWAEAAVGGKVELAEAPRLALTWTAGMRQGGLPPGLPAGTRFDGLRAKGSLDGPLVAPTAEVTLNAETVALRGVRAQRVAISGRADLTPDALAAHLTLDAAMLAYERATVSGLRGEAHVAGTLAAPVVDFRSAAAGAERDGAAATGIAAEGRISGPLDAAVAELQLSVAEARYGSTSTRGLAISGRIAGPFDRPAATLQLSLAQLAHGSSAARQLRLTGKLATDGDLTIEGDAGDVVVRDDPIPAFEKAPFKIAAEGRLDAAAGTVEVRSLRLALPTLTLTGRGGIGIESGDADFAGDARLADISPFGRLVELPLSGATDVHLSLRRHGADGILSGTLTGRLHRLESGRPELTALLGAEPGYATDWRLDADGRLALRALRLDARVGTLTGELTLAPEAERLQAELRAELPDIAVLAPVTGVAGSGRAGLAVTLSGPLQAPDASIELKIENAQVEGYALGAIAVSAELGGPLDALAGSLRLKATPGPGPLDLSTRFRRQDQRLLLDDLSLRGEGLSASGRLAVDLATLQASGGLKLDVAELAPWAALAQLRASGGLRADVTLNERAGAQAIGAKLHLSEFSMAPPGRMPVTGESVQLDLTTTWPAAAAGGRLDVDARSLTYGGASVSRLTLRATGTPLSADFTVDAAGRWQEPVTLAAAGRMTREGDTIALELARLQATGLDLDLALERPTRLLLGTDRVEIASLAARIGKGHIAVNGHAGLQGLDLRAEGRALPLAPLTQFGVAAKGDANFQLRLQGDWPDPGGDANLEINGLQLIDAGDVPPVSARVAAQWHDGRLAFNGAIDAGAATPLQLDGELALSARASPWAVSIPPEAPLSARLYWSGEVGQLWGLVPLPEHRLKGLLTADLRLSGTGAAPTVGGQVTLARGEYEHLRYGTLLRNLEAALVADGTRRLRLSRLRASDGEGGRLSGSGEVRFDDPHAPSFEAKLDLKDFLALRRDDVTARVDADLALDGNPWQAAAKGVITTRQVEARVDNTLSSDVVKLDVIEIGGDRGRQPGEPPQRARHLAVQLDLLVRVPGQAYLRGRGLDSEWSGELNIGGSTAAPQIAGKLHSVRGTFAVLGKTFKLQQSDIAAAPHEGATDALLDISAINSSSDLDVIVKAGGWASAPELSWSSVPALPQDEILSRLLFNKGTGQLTPFEAVQLAAAVAELSGHGGGSIIDTLRGAIGIDTLRLSGEGESGPKVEAGKYLSDEVFIGVGQGAATGSSSGRVELQVLPNVSIESEVEATGGANVGVKFKWDY